MMPEETNNHFQFWRRKRVMQETGLPLSSLYDQITKGRFPKQIRLTAFSVAWRSDEVEQWKQERVAESRGEVA